ncbi:MAG: pilin [bacterium]|nr:pilin [bacterium]
MKKRLAGFFIVFFFCTFFSGSATFAQTEIEKSIHGAQSQFIEAGKVFGIDDKTDVQTPGAILINIINVIFGLLGLVLVIAIMYSGFQWMASSGEVEKAKKARRNLTNALIGAAIVILAWSISYGVIGIITSDIVK